MDKIEPFQCSKGRDIKQRHVKNISKTSFVELKENINLFLHDIYIYISSLVVIFSLHIPN